MIYEFECNNCNIVKEVYRKVKDCSLEEECVICGKPMDRVFSTNFTVFKSYYNHGLGLRVNKKQDVMDELKKVKDTTDCELIEVGNEKQNPKRKKISYDLNRNEYQQVKKLLKEGS